MNCRQKPSGTTRTHLFTCYSQDWIWLPVSGYFKLRLWSFISTTEIGDIETAKDIYSRRDAENAKEDE